MPNRKENYKDMNKYLKTRNKQRRKYYGKTAFKYGSRPWTREEKELVMLHQLSDSELSSVIQRSVGAIQKRRCLLKKKLKDSSK